MDLSKLNAQQKDAVLNSYDRDTLLVAPAGSGKTKTLISRVEYLIKEKRISPSEIMMLTFTNKAAGEMMARLGNSGIDIKDLWCGTFHSTCLRMLKQFGKHIGLNRFTIMDMQDNKALMVETLDSLLIPSDKENVNHYLDVLSSFKNNYVKPTEIIDKARDFNDAKGLLEGKVYKEHLDRCWNKGYLDFDDLLVYAIVLLQNSKATRDWFHNKFKYILADEFQDSNKPNVMLMKLLKNQNTNIFAVGKGLLTLNLVNCWELLRV